MVKKSLIYQYIIKDNSKTDLKNFLKSVYFFNKKTVYILV